MRFNLGDIEAASVVSLKAQSPSTLGWRLRVELRKICRSVEMIDWGAPYGLMDSRRYRSPVLSP
jgi:hypothetical protein